MKKSIKMIPVIAGMTLAFLGSTDTTNASHIENSTNGSYCEPAPGVCIINSDGTVFHGRLVEGG